MRADKIVLCVFICWHTVQLPSGIRMNVENTPENAAPCVNLGGRISICKRMILSFQH